MKISVGTDIFQKYREAGNLYVDKSLLIREVLHGSEVLLLPRPRRFGKTLNMTMLHAFFDMTQNSRPLFEGLAITDDADAMTHLNAHPTIFLSLKRIGQSDTWAAACSLLRRMIAALYRTARPLISSLTFDREEQAYHDRIFDPDYAGHPLPDALAQLTEFLHRATGKKVVLLIDEYDAPIHRGLEKGYYNEVVDFFRVFLGEALKSNPHLERAVLTGILRVAKESIFSGLNNLRVHTILDEPFSTCFGFTDAEVETLVAMAKSPHPMSEIRQWYNGYCFGKTTIYNPWSILSMLDRGDAGLDAHWVNTSGNELIRQQVQKGGCDLADLETLLRGERIRVKLTSQVALRDISPDSVWSLFLFAGYLTAENYNASEQTADLYIPNYEVQRFFRDTVQVWLGGYRHGNLLIAALLQGKLETFFMHLQETVVTIMSYHDTARKQPERVFHVFILGLLAHLADQYQVASNRETGHGRGDLQLIPRKPGQPGFLFEFKVAASAKPATLRAAASAALEQAHSQDYLGNFRQANVSTLYTLGLASHGKHLALASTVQTLPDGPPSEPSYHLSDPEPSDSPARGTDTAAPSKKSSRRKRESEVTRPVNNPSAEQSSAERDQKIALIAQIQLLQELKGRTPLLQDILMPLDVASLQALLKDLKA